METGKVPVDWKKANVTAMYKKGRRETAGNYRPVSLTSHVGKVLESIIPDSIVNHLDRNKLIYNTQHGFVKGRSCLTNLLEFLEDVTEYVDQGSPVDAIYLEFQNAFDKVPHQRLLKKVQALGINGTAYTWIEDRLKNRTQRVQFGEDSSNWTSVLCGVPQGSVLGPILFLIYINDIDDGIESKILKFADVTKLYRRITSEEDVTKLQEDLATLFRWSTEWLMLFNVDKCKILHLGHGNKRVPYTMNGEGLQAVQEEVDLGIVIQEDHKWACQCAKVVGKANRTLGLIKRCFGHLTEDVFLKLYKSLVRPKLEYAIQA
jgi:ribonuclease P/MRP protein subunit RPP40